jgi:NADPH2:quinone reductase
VQLARQWGAGLIVATATSAHERDLALTLGADVAVDPSGAGTPEEVHDLLCEAAGGTGVDVVVGVTGGHVAEGSLRALVPWGRLVVHDLAWHKPVAPVDLRILMARTISVVGFQLPHAVRRPGGLHTAMEELISLLRSNRLKPVLGRRYPLADVRSAHEALLSPRATGKLVLAVR